MIIWVLIHDVLSWSTGRATVREALHDYLYNDLKQQMGLAQLEALLDQGCHPVIQVDGDYFALRLEQGECNG